MEKGKVFEVEQITKHAKQSIQNHYYLDKKISVYINLNRQNNEEP